MCWYKPRVTQNWNTLVGLNTLAVPCWQRFLCGAPAAVTCTCRFQPTTLLISSTTRHKHGHNVKIVEAKDAPHLKTSHPIRLLYCGSHIVDRWLNLVKLHVWKRKDFYSLIFLLHLWQLDLLIPAAQLIRVWFIVSLIRIEEMRPQDRGSLSPVEQHQLGHVTQIAVEAVSVRSRRYNRSVLVPGFPFKHRSHQIFSYYLLLPVCFLSRQEAQAGQVLWGVTGST